MQRALVSVSLSATLLWLGCSRDNGGHSGPVVIPPDLAAGSGGTGGVGGAQDMAVGTSPTASPDLAGLPPPDHPATEHPPLPRMTGTGKSTVAAPEIWTVVWKGDAADTGAKVQTFTKWLVGSDFWMSSLAEYGVGVGTAGQVIELDTPPPKTINERNDGSGDLGKLVDTKLGTPGWPNKGDNLIISFVTNAKTDVVISPIIPLQPPKHSCKDFGGYHAIARTSRVPYLVNAFCPGKDMVTPDWNNLTIAISHEAGEAASDWDLGHNHVVVPGTEQQGYPIPYIGGGEVGDMCLAVDKKIVTATGDTYFVQRMYSDLTAQMDNADPNGKNVNPCLTNDPSEAYFGVGFWSGETADQSTLHMQLAQDCTGEATFKLEPFSYDPNIGPIQFQIYGNAVPPGMTFDPDVAVRKDPSHPSGPPTSGAPIWGVPGSTTTVKVKVDPAFCPAPFMQPTPIVQLLVLAKTVDGRANVWWANIQSQ
jgi:hypothetical protein